MILAALATLPMILAQVPEAPPPDPSVEDPAAVTVPAPEPPPAVAPTPAPPTAPQAPRFRGIGLAVSAGVVGGLGLAINLSRIAIIQTGCTAMGDVGDSVSACLSKLGGYLALSASAPLVNLAATGLASGAGSTAGRYQAWKTAYGGGRERVAGAYIGSGAGLLGLGIIVYLTTRIMLFRDAYGVAGCEAKGDLTSDCVRGRFSGWLGGITIGQSMVVTGSGLLSFGASYAGARRYFPGNRQVRMQLDPVLAPTWAGLSLRGSF